MAAQKMVWELPVNRSETESIKIVLQKAEMSKLFPDEVSVRFALGGKNFDGWMPRESVNLPEKWLKAIIVGDYKNGDWEIYIPDETLQSTKVLRVPKDEQEEVVLRDWW